MKTELIPERITSLLSAADHWDQHTTGAEEMARWNRVHGLDLSRYYLLHNEFIIYNLKQHILQYLVEFSTR